MDHRRAIRPPISSRRNLFHPARRQHALDPKLSKTAVHIAAEESDPKDDLVERDSAGNYSMLAPTTAMKMGVNSVRSELDDETEQENQMIALYGKQNHHWDQAAILEEIKAALQSSLEKKVQSLEHDRWMFEGDGKSKG
ncbi:hypothetical protein BU26DRAFT_516218 [Trematosphaeria pertusa]|uniref:Uncharacterized protein n=1 Tax=Trematosphaeria pertusa TaxID=390896 RepID=A0A6A6IU38_9PLEO|nr:uncharacterized protein BU26DRAFT_516218 [Trematosphaeria pertusa]KAF2253964.1 hypothetical protein BU26DRAFT_516218 [Trematosphaeria pertusa]